MSASLYQKYRPDRFIDVIGQDHISTTLRNEVEQQRVGHAYLLSGPRGVGKTSTARLLARAVNCSSPVAGEPDNNCDNCQTILRGQALDVVEIDAASHTGVDNVRENIIDSSRVAPTQLPWKVFIIDEVHMLSTSAFNALLKTLEEPPTNTIFILATTELHKVPETVVSRCERFGFHRVAPDVILGRLVDLVGREQRQVDKAVLRTIAKRANGGVRDAESLLGQVLALSNEVITEELANIVLPRSTAVDGCGLLDDIINNDPQAGLARIQQLLDTGVVLSLFVQEWIEMLRQLLLSSVQQSDEPISHLYLPAEVDTRLRQLRSSVNPSQIAAMIRSAMAALDAMKTASIEQLPLELAIIDLTAQAPTPDARPQPQAKPAAAVPAATTPDPGTIPMPEITEEPPEASFHQRRIPDTSAKTPPATETSVAQVAPTITNNQPVTHQLVQQRWQDVLDAIREKNHALHLTFKVGQLVSVENNTLTMGFQYQFYQDRLNDVKNSAMIVAALEQVFGHIVQLQTVIGNQYTPDNMKNNPEANIEEPSSDEIANVWELAATVFPEDRQVA